MKEFACGNHTDPVTLKDVLNALSSIEVGFTFSISCTCQLINIFCFMIKPYSSTILRLFLTWILSFYHDFTDLDQNGIHQHS